jgi:hypothetical protein
MYESLYGVMQRAVSPSKALSAVAPTIKPA